MNPATWVVSTLAGSREGYVDGECKSSLFRCPSAFAFSPQGFVYLADRSNNSIRKLDLKERHVKTVDRTGLSQPTSIAWSPEGFFLVADRNNHKIKMFKIDEGILQHFSGSDSGYADGAKDICRFSNPSSLVSTIDGQVYVSDLGNDRIRLLSRDGAATTYAGSHGGFADGPRTKALFSKPWGLFLSSYSELFICDWGNNRIRMVDNHGVVSTIAGTGNTGSTDGLGNFATFNCPISLVLTPQNDILVADRNNHKIRYIKKLSTGWEVSTFAGSTTGLVDGKCSAEAKFTQPTALAWTPSGQLLVSSNDCIRMIEEVASGPRETDSALSTSFDVLFNAPFSDCSFLSHSGHQFALHRPILLSRCEVLANQSIWRSMEALAIPTESWQHFWNFLYIDQLPSTDVSVAQKLEVAKEYCDLHLISHICSMKILSDHCKHTIKSLVVGNIDSISELLSVVTSRNIEPNHPLFYMILDLISVNLNGDKHKIVATVGQLLSSKLSFQESALERITSYPQFNELQSMLHNATGSLYVHLSRLCSITPDSMQKLASSSRPTDPLVPYDYAIRIDDTIIECHKCILYARWPYFRTMMNAGLSEAIHGEAQFSSSPDDGFTVEAMKALLWFFYSDSPSLFTYENGIEVMTGAGRFGFVDFSSNAPNPGFEELIRFCSIPLHVTPSVQNSVSLHKIAMRVGDEERTKITRRTIIAGLPAIFLDSKLKAEFESLDIEEKYSLLQDAFSRLVEVPKDR